MQVHPAPLLLLKPDGSWHLTVKESCALRVNPSSCPVFSVLHLFINSYSIFQYFCFKLRGWLFCVLSFLFGLFFLFGALVSPDIYIYVYPWM